MIKMISVVLIIVGISFCVAGLMGHSGAWAGAAMCLFAATMPVIAKRKK